jgi:CD80-like C2-set immunoglobulin domain
LARIYYNNQEVTDGQLAGPLDAGQSASLLCVAEGGRPAPAVLWYRNAALIDSSWEDQSSAASAAASRVSNVMVLPRVGRQEARDRFSCRAGHNNISSSSNYNINNSSSVDVEATVGLRINFPPEAVTISQLPEEIHTGKAFHVRCRAVGAQPSVAFTWWLDGQQLQLSPDDSGGIVADEDEPEDKNSERTSFSSYLYRKFLAEDNGKMLTCRATNPALSTSHVAEASRRLNVLFPPRPRLVYGTNIRPDEVREGQDVYLQCQAAANPPVSRLTWARNGFPVVPGKQCCFRGPI